MKFTRIDRKITYRSHDCKLHLRKDFIYTCAYCGIREGDLGGADSFQIDHFKPTIKGGDDNYLNLYYCCTTCNGKSGKSDQYTPTMLDPCKEDIWNDHLSLDNSTYYCYEKTNLGKEFISLIKLNRTKYIERRRKIIDNRKALEDELQTLKLLAQRIIMERNDDKFALMLNKRIEDIDNIIKYGQNYLMVDE